MTMTTTATPRAEIDELNDALDRHLIRCLSDFKYYARHNLKIRTKEGSLISFELNEVQNILEEIISDIQKNGRLIRLCILKARQEGVSTWVTGRYFWKVTTNKNRSATIVTHEPAATRNLFNMQKRFYTHLPQELKPKDKYNNVKELQFNSDDGTGLDSSIGVGTAGVKDFGSSQTINYLHISELSKWPKENEGDLMISLLQCVPRTKESSVIIESTAKGVSGEFYRRYLACRYTYELYLDDNQDVRWRMKINEKADPAGSYSSIFIPWFVFKKYREAAPDDFERTPEEERLAERYNLDNDQLMWYRSILVDECKGDLTKRAQEYPCNAREAFVSTGSPAFNVQRVQELMNRCTPPKFRYSYNYTTGELYENEDGDIWIWEQPQRGVPYLISADVAEGLEHGDANSVIVWNHRDGVQVAHCHNRVRPLHLAALIERLGHMYNDAWVVPERNNHGISVVEKLLENDYPNIYVEMIETPPHRPRRRFGWLTSSKSRTLILDHLIHDVYEGVVGIKDIRILDEMLVFKTQPDGKIEADPGEHDDMVMSAAIGRYVMKNLDYVCSTGFMSYTPEMSSIVSVQVQKEISPLAWN